MADKPKGLRLSCPECGEPMLKVLSLDEDKPDRYSCPCCGGAFLPCPGDPYAGLDEVMHQENHRGDRKGGGLNKGRFGKQKKPVKKDRVQLHY